MKLAFNRASLRKGTFSHIKFSRLLKDVALIILLWMCVKTWTEPAYSVASIHKWRIHVNGVSADSGRRWISMSWDWAQPLNEAKWWAYSPFFHAHKVYLSSATEHFSFCIFHDVCVCVCVCVFVPAFMIFFALMANLFCWRMEGLASAVVRLPVST